MPNPTMADAKITGRVILGFQDIYAAAYLNWPARLRWAYWISLVVVIAYTFWLDDVHDIDTFNESGLTILVAMLILAAVGSLAMIALFCARMSPEQKQIDYEIDQERIVIHDAMGATVIMPWTQVKACYEHKTGFNLRIRPIGSRWLPKRAFAPNDLKALRALTKSLLGSG